MNSELNSLQAVAQLECISTSSPKSIGYGNVRGRCYGISILYYSSSLSSVPPTSNDSNLWGKNSYRLRFFKSAAAKIIIKSPHLATFPMDHGLKFAGRAQIFSTFNLLGVKI